MKVEIELAEADKAIVLREDGRFVLVISERWGPGMVELLLDRADPTDTVWRLSIWLDHRAGEVRAAHKEAQLHATRYIGPVDS